MTFLEVAPFTQVIVCFAGGIVVVVVVEVVVEGTVVGEA